jgi:predicted PurR-regulated permease PerM
VKTLTKIALEADVADETENFHQDESPLVARETPNVRSLTLTQVTQIAVILTAVIAFAYLARPLVLPVMLAWVASMALKPPVSWLRAHHLPSPLAAALVVGVVVVGIFFAVGSLGRPAAAWLKTYPQAAPHLKQKFERLFHPLAGLNLVPSAIASVNSTTNQPSHTAPSPAPSPANDQIITTVFNWTGTALAGIVETVAMLFLLLASGDLFMQKMVHVMPTLRDKKNAVEMSHEIQQSISRYLFSVGLINICLGSLVGTAFYFLHLPNAVMWGAVVVMANFIPYFGPILGMIAVALAGLISFDTVGQGLAPAGVYLACHLIEANLVTPYALGRRFTLNPVIIFVFLIFCIWLWGIIGAFLAVPILVTLKVICDRINRLSPLGEFLAN